MKAWVLHDIAQIEYEETEKPEIKENEVLVEVKAAGICGSDIPRIYKTGTYSFPLIVGHEFSGKVADCASEENKKWLGKRVGIFPLIPCRECPPCREHKYEMCRQYSYLGSRRNGGFAQYAAVPADNLIELPDTVSYEEAAMLEPMAVAVHAMRRAEKLSKDKPIVVCGLGTIGMLLMMFLLDAGFSKLLVIGNKDFQKQKVLEMGLKEDAYCSSKETDAEKWIMEQTGKRGGAVFFECVGRNETVTLGINSLMPGGELVLIGNPASDICLEKNTYWKILRNQLTLKGTWNSSFLMQDEEEVRFTRDDWYYVLQRMTEKKISPELLITHRFPLAELDQGFLIMRDKKEGCCKVMGVNDGTAEKVNAPSAVGIVPLF